MRDKTTKYKAKNMNGEWVEGIYYQQQIFKDEEGKISRSKKIVKHYILTDCLDGNGIKKEEVLYETVSQLLKISRGKGIYENDIVKIIDGQGNFFREGCVEYNKENEKFCIRTTKDFLELDRYLDLGWIVESKESLYDVD